MENKDVILNTFNQVLKDSLDTTIVLDLEELKCKQTNLELNNDENNIFDAVLDIIIFSIGAIHKISKLAGLNPIDLAKSPEEEKIIERIVTWNKERNLNTFNFRSEFSFIIEEIYEASYIPHDNSHQISLKITDSYFLDVIMHYQHEFQKEQTFFINIYKAFLKIGTKFALEYEPSDVFFYLNQVMTANEKKGKNTDSVGKIIKDKTTFIAPEKSFIKK